MKTKDNLFIFSKIFLKNKIFLSIQLLVFIVLSFLISSIFYVGYNVALNTNRVLIEEILGKEFCYYVNSAEYKLNDLKSLENKYNYICYLYQDISDDVYFFDFDKYNSDECKLFEFDTISNENNICYINEYSTLKIGEYYNFNSSNFLIVGKFKSKIISNEDDVIIPIKNVNLSDEIHRLIFSVKLSDVYYKQVIKKINSISNEIESMNNLEVIINSDMEKLADDINFAGNILVIYIAVTSLILVVLFIVLFVLIYIFKLGYYHRSNDLVTQLYFLGLSKRRINYHFIVGSSILLFIGYLINIILFFIFKKNLYNISNKMIKDVLENKGLGTFVVKDYNPVIYLIGEGLIIILISLLILFINSIFKKKKRTL